MSKRTTSTTNARKADTVSKRKKRTKTTSTTSGSDQQGPSGSTGRTEESQPDSTSQEEDGQANSRNNMELPSHSTGTLDVSPHSTSTPKKLARTDAASAAKKQMRDHDKSPKGLKSVTFAAPTTERRSKRPRKSVDKLGGFPVFTVTQEADDSQEAQTTISAPPSRPTSPDLHPELETNTLLQSSNARDTSSKGVANSSQQPPPHLQ